jgi:hypothetical protein
MLRNAVTAMPEGGQYDELYFQSGGILQALVPRLGRWTWARKSHGCLLHGLDSNQPDSLRQ